MKNNKELLERVLLMMNYDSSKTLNENVILMNEQYAWPSVLQQGLDLNKSKNYSGPNWSQYLTGISSTKLADLYKIQKGFSDAGYGAISPGLQGFTRPNPTPATLALENEIYVRALKDYENKKSKGIYSVKPAPPESTLIPITGGGPYMKSIIGKPATQLLQQIQQKEAQDNLTKKGCLFKNKDEGDAFREWFNDSYPKLAQKNQLDRSGNFCNSYINNVANAVFKEGMFKGQKVYKVYKDLTADLSKYNPKSKIPKVDITAKQDRLSSDINNQLNKEVQIQKNEASQKEERENYLNEIFDFSKFPVELPLTQYNKTTGEYGGYESNYWTEPNTKIKVYIQGKTKDEVLDDLIALYEKQEEEKYKQDLLKTINESPLINQLFTKEQIQKSFEECNEEGLLSFFKDILDGKKKNSEGNVVGKYYNQGGRSVMAKWTKPIPCEDKFWSEYGAYIQIGGMLAAAILLPGIGLSASAAAFAELAVDFGLNVYSLKQSIKSQDEDLIKLDLLYTMLPFIMKAGPVVKLLEDAKFGRSVINSVENKMSSLPQNASRSQVESVLNGMTAEEKRLISQLGTSKYKNEIQKVAKSTLENLKKSAKAPLGRKLAEPLINLFVYSTPIGGFLLKKLSEIDKLYKNAVKRSPTQEEEKLWAYALSKLDENDQNKLITNLQNNPEALKKIINSPEMATARAKAAGMEGKSEEDIKKGADEFLKDLDNLLNTIINESKSDVTIKNDNDIEFK